MPLWTDRNRIFASQFFNADDGNPGGGTPPESPPKEEKVTFSPEQQQYLNNLLAAERKEAEEKTALKIKADADLKAQSEREARERDEAAARGEFDKVRTDLESKVTTIEGERDALAGEAESLRTYFDAQYTAALKDLPDVITAFKPADDASFSVKADWLSKAKEQAVKVGKMQTPGNNPNPSPANGTVDHNAEVAKAKARGAYTA